jgi:tetratricopeptide repeat protein
MKRSYSVVMLCAMVLLAAGAFAAAGPAGQLLDVQGRVQIRHGSQPPRAGGLLAELQPGDTLKVVSGRAEVVLFPAGARFALSAGSAVRVQASRLQRLAGPPPRALPPASQPFAQPLSVARRPIPQKLLGVITRGGGEDTQGPHHLSPHGAVRQPPVVLRWEGPVEGEQLEVQISNGDQIVHRASLPGTARSCEVPAGVLKPGPWYAWFVTAAGSAEGPRKEYALLRLLTSDERQALAREEHPTDPARSAAAGSPAAEMRLAQLYERLGLFPEARTHYLAVQRLRPDDPGAREALARLRNIAPP